MKLSKFKIPDVDMLNRARAELAVQWHQSSDRQGPWGFYAIENVAPDNSAYASCHAFKAQIMPLLPEDHKFAMVQYYPKYGSPRNGALHLDVNVTNSIKREIPDGMDVFRTIINMHDSPRILMTEGESIAIPARVDDQAWMLQFWSSRVQHVGYTTREGQFIFVAGAYRKWNG